MPEFNPVLIKELRSRMRGARAFVLLTIYLLILSGVTLLLYAAISDISSSDLNGVRQIGKALFLLITTVALTEVCLITPTLTAGGIAGEKERQTYDLLVSSLLTPWQIAWGKLGAALSFALLMILAVVPLMSLAFIFGGVSLAEVLIALTGLVVTAVFYATIGLFWSAALRSSLGATSLALGSIIMMLLGIPFLALIFALIFGNSFADPGLNSAVSLYLAGAFLFSHPYIALQASESQLSSGDNPFYTRITIGNAFTSRDSLLVPSPWIVYVLLSLLFTALLLLLTTRMLRVAKEAPQRRSAAEKNDG